MLVFPMKQTPEDRIFAADFGRELRRHYERSTQRGVEGLKLSDEEFAATLDVSRPALKKYLHGATTPALRVVVLAYLRYGINVNYFGTPLFGKRKRKESTGGIITQLVLPFSVQGLNTASIQTKVEPKGQNGFELKVDIRRAG
jgi:transcriptional regulator with XRE-family HTH domain